LHRPFSKISVSKDANLARYHREQRRAMRERLAEYEAEWEDSGSSYRRPTHTSSSNDKSAVGGGTLLEQQVREMVTKHDAEASGESNAEKLMNLEFENDVIFLKKSLQHPLTLVNNERIYALEKLIIPVLSITSTTIIRTPLLPSRICGMEDNREMFESKTYLFWDLNNL